MKVLITSLSRLLQMALVICFLSSALPALPQDKDSTTKENSEEALIKYFSKLDLEQFKGKIVDSFLLAVKHPFSSMVVEPSTSVFYQGVVKLMYPQNITAHLFVDEFRRANPHGMSKKRQTRMAGKEIIADIQIHNDVACIQGCN